MNEFFAISIIALNVGLLCGFLYDFENLHSEIFLPCPEYPDHYLSRYVTIPENITLMPDDTIQVVGDFLVIYDFPPMKKYKLVFDVYKRVRGSWQATIYNVRREDYCVSLFNSNEVWGPFVKNIPEDQRRCPLQKGQSISLNIKTEQGFDLPSPALEGEYWGRCTLGDTSSMDDFACFDYFFNIHRA